MWSWHFIHYSECEPSLFTLWAWFMEGTLDSCCSSHACHDQARHCCFCWAGRAFACRHPECQAETRTGWACVECRLGWEGAGSVTKLNEEIESEEWLAWTSAHHDHSSILWRAEGLMLLRHQHPLVKKTRQQQHSSDLSLCADVDPWVI